MNSMNIEILVNDLSRIISQYHDRYKSIILVGHSMGAAVISHLPNHSKVKAIILLDIVEDLAIQSIQRRFDKIDKNNNMIGNNNQGKNQIYKKFKYPHLDASNIIDFNNSFPFSF